MAAQLKIGQRVQVRSSYSGEEWFSSRIEDITEDAVVVGVPIKGGNLVPIPEGESIEVLFPQDDAIYSFTSVVRERRPTPVAVLVVEMPRGFHRIQRRKLFRLPVVMEARYRLAKSEDESKAITLDLSGGGVCIITTQPLDKGLQLELDLRLGGEYVTVLGRVVKCHEVEERSQGNAKRYSVGVEFRDIPSAVQERIVQFIFQQQRERRQREMGIK